MIHKKKDSLTVDLKAIESKRMYPVAMLSIEFRRLAFFLLLSLPLLPTLAVSQPLHAKTTGQCVVLIHGLARTASSMDTMQQALQDQGYSVINIDYPSRELRIEDLAATVVPKGISFCNQNGANTIHFVTHSLGGILVRYYFAHHDLDNLGRVVMLSPPNQGSEVVDTLKDMPGFHLLNGPAGDQLGTDDSSIPRRLPSVDYEVGIITGDQTINYILSTFIPGDDDGKVSIESAKVAGMTDFIIVPHSHPFIMSADDVIVETLTFLQNGYFNHSLTETSSQKN